MQPRKKVLIVIGILLLISIPTLFFIMNLLNPPPPKPFDLADAPVEIQLIKQDLKEKLEDDTLSWDDINDFIILSQYIADNSPDVADLVEGWEKTAVIDVTDAGYLWFIVENNIVIIETGSTPPSSSDVTITMKFEIFSKILANDETAISSFQKGDLDFTGALNDALKIGRLARIFAVTIMDGDMDIIPSTINLIITEDNPELYEKGLTLMPCTEMIVDNGTSTFGVGHVIIYDHDGNIKAQLDDSLHWVHKFINSTTVLMGGAEGYAQLWNYVTGVIETLPIPGGHHELDYNPKTDTYLVLEDAYSNETWDGRYILYDILSEYNSSGDLVWQWDARIEYPFNETIYTGLNLNETFRAGTDWMHSNSFSWDKDDDVIFLNMRNQDTILKINRTTNNILWAAGRYGDFTILNVSGYEVDSIFFHPHSLEWIGPNRFIIFDNGLYNPDYPPSMVLGTNEGYSRFVEFEIDEDNMIMREVWSWGPTNLSYYFPDSGGDADRLPNGNTIGIFANKALTNSVDDPVIITEVTRDGEVAWELMVPGANNTNYWTHRLERFYNAPIIKVDNNSLDFDSTERTLSLNLSVWDTFKQDAPSPGHLKIRVNGIEIYNEAFDFLKQWQETELQVSLTELPASVNYIQLIIENADGLQGIVLLYGIVPEGTPTTSLIIPFMVVTAIVVPAIFLVLIKTGRLSIRRSSVMVINK
ncbi:hypothetical protein EU527_09155 [Candidatus Thorarchaeota archaeon]|nr:MAG: hypothetical protein EU527_09155 [Candidatus Thorarchaeota archaeon]